jgi:hypothetical protein
MIGNLLIISIIFAAALGTGTVIWGLYDLLPVSFRIKVSNWFDNLIQ